MYAVSIQKTLKTLNFTTTYAILMKLTTDIYLNKVFHLAESWGVSSGHKQKNSQNESKNQFFGPI